MNKNVDTRYIKAILFAASLIFLVMYFKPDVPVQDSELEEQNQVQVEAPQIPVGDVSDNYIANAINTKGEINKWAETNIPVYIEYNPTYMGLVNDAFNSYNNTFAGMFNFYVVDNSSTAKIIVRFTSRLEDTISNQLITGLTNTRIAGNIITSATITLLTEINGRNIPSNKFYPVVLHEIGHALGIFGHSTNISDIMYSHADEGGAMSLSARDISTLKIMYSNNTALIDNSKGDYQSQKLQEAIDYANRVPDKTVGWINLGKTYYDAKMLPEALEAYKKALTINANDPNIYSGMAECYFESKKYSSAAQFYQYAIERSSDIASTEIYRYMKSISSINSDNFLAAFNELSLLITQQPDKKEYISAYVMTCIKLNKPEGKFVLKNYIQKHPEEKGDVNLSQYLAYYGIH